MKTPRHIVIIILLIGIFAAATPVVAASALSEMVFYVH